LGETHIVSLAAPAAKQMAAGQGNVLGDFDPSSIDSAGREVDWQMLNSLIVSGAKYANPNLKLIVDRPNVFDDSPDPFAGHLRKNWNRFDGLFVAPTINLGVVQRLVDQTVGELRVVSAASQDKVLDFVSQWLEGTIVKLDGTGLIAEDARFLPQDASALKAIREQPAVEPSKTERKFQLTPVDARTIDPAALPYTVDVPVFVEENALTATFALSRLSESQPMMHLQRPDGSIAAAGDADVELSVDHERFRVVRVKSPAAGRWFMRLERQVAANRCPFRIAAYTQNLSVRTTLTIKSTARENDVAHVRIEVKVRCPKPVIGVAPIVVSVFEFSAESGFNNAPIAQIVLQLDRDVAKDGVHPVQPVGYFAEVKLRLPQLYLFVAQVAQVGQATPLHMGPVYRANNNQPPPSIPPFIRILRRQVYLA
jgi:hypothetical protein